MWWLLLNVSSLKILEDSEARVLKVELDFLYLIVLLGAAYSTEFHLGQNENLREVLASKQLTSCHKISYEPEPSFFCLPVTALVIWQMFNLFCLNSLF